MACILGQSWRMVLVSVDTLSLLLTFYAFDQPHLYAHSWVFQEKQKTGSSGLFSGINTMQWNYYFMVSTSKSFV